MRDFESKLDRKEKAIKKTKSMDLLPMILAPGVIARMMEYHRYRLAKGFPEKVFIADLEQTLGSRGASCGLDLPVLLTHGQIMNIPADISQWRLACSMEHLLAQGFHTLDNVTSTANPISKMLRIFESLSIANRKQLSGNGMHLGTQGSWMMYCLSQLAPVTPFCRSLSPSCWEEMPADQEDVFMLSQLTATSDALGDDEDAHAEGAD